VKHQGAAKELLHASAFARICGCLGLVPGLRLEEFRSKIDDRGEPWHLDFWQGSQNHSYNTIA
jgi:hypothetical protein